MLLLVKGKRPQPICMECHKAHSKRDCPARIARWQEELEYRRMAREDSSRIDEYNRLLVSGINPQDAWALADMPITHCCDRCRKRVNIAFCPTCQAAIDADRQRAIEEWRLRRRHA